MTKCPLRLNVGPVESVQNGLLMIEVFCGRCYQECWRPNSVLIRVCRMIKHTVLRGRRGGIKVGSECGTAGGEHGPVRMVLVSLVSNRLKPV